MVCCARVHHLHKLCMMDSIWKPDVRILNCIVLFVGWGDDYQMCVHL